MPSPISPRAVNVRTDASGSSRYFSLSGACTVRRSSMVIVRSYVCRRGSDEPPTLNSGAENLGAASCPRWRYNPTAIERRFWIRAERSGHVLLREGTRSHPLRGVRFRLPAAAHRRRGTQLDDLGLDQRIAVRPDRGIQGRVPLHRGGPPQRERRPVLPPARDRAAVGCLYRPP